VSMDALFGLREQIFEMLGRDSTLTNRTELWEVVRAQKANSFVGAGFMSFWTGARMAAVWAALGVGINQAHNGYLEQFLNLGYVGVAFIFLLMLVAVGKILTQFKSDPDVALLRLCLLVAIALFNYTEAAFYGVSSIWTLFLVACLDVTPLSREQREPQVATSTVATQRTSTGLVGLADNGARVPVPRFNVRARFERRHDFKLTRPESGRTLEDAADKGAARIGHGRRGRRTF